MDFTLPFIASSVHFDDRPLGRLVGFFHLHNVHRARIEGLSLACDLLHPKFCQDVIEAVQADPIALLERCHTFERVPGELLICPEFREFSLCC